MKIHDVISFQVLSWFVAMFEFCKGYVMPFCEPLSQVYLHLWGDFHFFHKLPFILSQEGRPKIKANTKAMV